MSNLQKMGIQQWRLKASLRSGPPEPEIQSEQGDELPVEIDGGMAISDPEALNDAVPEPVTQAEAAASIAETEPSIGSALISNDTGSDQTQLSPAPLAAPVKAKGQGSIESLDWQGLQDLIESDQNCPSCSRTNSLLGVGNPNADWLFVIDAPNSRELNAQELLVGRAGTLFDAILSAVGLAREDIYLSSVFKCAPTDDLSSSPQCNEVVRRQIELIEPEVVVTLGEFAAQSVIRANDGLPALRESAQRCYSTQVPIVPTYSPSEMLANPELKALVWQDLKKAMELVAT